MNNLIQNDHIKSFIDSLFYTLISLGFSKLISVKLFPHCNKIALTVITIVGIVSYSIGIISIILGWSIYLTLFFLFFPLVVLFYLILKFWQFLNAGVYDIDLKIKKGIDYQKSLSLCKTQLDFLGVGASKLTALSEFEEAIKNCQQDLPIRFLLMRPDNAKLIDAAKRAKKDRDEFTKKVRESLRKISELKEKYNNIEVRFYNFKPIFRLMFINDSICLFSYNVFGIGDGSQFPQLIIKNTKIETKNFYSPMKQYFENLWQNAEVWDFKAHL